MTEDFIKSYKKQLKGFSEAQKVYLLAKAWYDFVKSEEVRCAQEVLEENVFIFPKTLGSSKRGFLCVKGNRITKADDIDFLVDNKDKFEKFLQLYDKKTKEAGLFIGHNICIDAEARKMKSESEDLLIEWAYSLIPELKGANLDAVKRHILYREKVIALAMKIKE